jgi:RND family efflux transporter MFP subunit
MLILWVVVLIVIGVLYVFLRGMFSSVREVETTTVSLIYPSQANAVLTASGYVVAQRKAAIASKATGRLVYLGYEEGDRVKKGEIIARIESADVEAALAQARATLAQYQAELTDARQSHERARQLLESQLVAQADYDAAKARYDRVVASIAAAQAATRAAEVNVENTLIRAPFDGTILSKNADVGEVVAPFAAGASSRVAVVTIADMSSLIVEADVSESNIERIAVDQPCDIALDAYPEKRYRGVVHKIVPTADRAKATVLTKIRFLDIDSRVLPEMSAKVNFLSKPADENVELKPILAVDASTVVTRNGQSVAFRVTGDIVEEIPVGRGRTLGGYVEILSGLTAKDKVVLRPSSDITSGSRVKEKK